MQKSEFGTSLSGYLLKDVMEILKQKGISVSAVNVIASPKSESTGYDENYRVIKIELKDENLAEIFVSKPF